MTSYYSSRSSLRQLEAKLEKQTDPRQRLVLLDQAISQFAFTDVRRAQKLLGEQKEILKHLDNPDLRLNFYINMAFVENQFYNFKLAKKHFMDAFELLEERGDVKQQAEAFIDFTAICINQKNLDLATEYLEKANKLLNRFPEPQLSARISVREGIIQLHYNNYSKAIELLLKAEKEFTSLSSPLDLKDNYFLTLIYSGLGNIYSRNNEAQKCVRAYLKVLDMCKALQMRTRLCWHHLNVGTAFLRLQDYEEAERYFELAIKITDDISQHARAGAYANLGYCYFIKQSYDEALRLYEMAELLFLEKSDYDNLFTIERWRAELFKVQNNKKKVKKHLHQAYQYARKRKDPRLLSVIFRDIADFYASIGEYEDAYAHLLEQIKAEEHYNHKLNSRRLMELEVKYEAEKKKREAELLDLKATKLQLKALRAQMNPHFMYNALNSIQNYITSNDGESAAKYLAKFSVLMRQSLEYSELEIIPLEKEREFLENYLSINQKLRFEDNLNYEILVSDDIEDDILGVPTMIVQPYVENAIEHGLRQRKNGWVRVIFALKDEDTILCTVEDNGIGRAMARQLQEKDQYHKTHRSMGTSITENRLKLLLKAEDKDIIVDTIDLIDEETGEARGTRVVIPIPVTEI